MLRDHNGVLDVVKAGMMSNPATQYRICYYKYALTTVKGASVNPLPHGVLATFSPTAGGLMGPPKKDDISREKTILYS